MYESNLVKVGLELETEDKSVRGPYNITSMFISKNVSSNVAFNATHLFCVHHQESEDGKTYFVKIHAPWEVLATYANVLKIKVPFKVADTEENSSEIPMNWLSTPFRLPKDIMHPEPDYFTAPFNKDKSDFFLIEDKDTFFPPSTRNRIVSIYRYLICDLQNSKAATFSGH